MTGQSGIQGVVMIDQKKDLKAALYFILENPTGTDHDFAVHGLYAILSNQITSGMRSDVFTGPFHGQRAEADSRPH